jgi:hypothetical protein
MGPRPDELDNLPPGRVREGLEYIHDSLIVHYYVN